MNKQHAMGIALAAGVALAAVNGSVSAAGNNCTRVGAWFGDAQASSGLTWLGTWTPGASATGGQFNFQWVAADPTFFGNFPMATRLGDGVGSWEKISHDEYKGSFVAYGFANGTPIYTLRASAILYLEDCDHTSFSYTAEFFLGAVPPQDLSKATLLYAVRNTGTETRMPLVLVP